uniref:Uncharacterized protein n=1 Tax=Globodera rostochiensis TaxID=31243 RepID=A0A914H478_GLORO
MQYRRALSQSMQRSDTAQKSSVVNVGFGTRDKPSTSASSPSINFEPNIQLYTSEDEDDSTNPPTKRKRRAEQTLHCCQKHNETFGHPYGSRTRRMERFQMDFHYYASADKKMIMIKLVEEIDLNEDENIGSDFSIEL